jgi:hypothetical protein
MIEVVHVRPGLQADKKNGRAMASPAFAENLEPLLPAMLLEPVYLREHVKRDCSGPATRTIGNEQKPYGKGHCSVITM